MSSIAIVGMGWLGVPLANSLEETGHDVKGSATRAAKVEMLKSKGFNAFRLLLTEDRLMGQPHKLFAHIETAIVLVPPGLRKNSGHDHVAKMKHLLTELIDSKVSNVILVSSTSVYGDKQGSVTEKDMPDPENENGRQLLEVEHLFWVAAQINTAIIRFGGLYGGNRHPVHYLAGRKDLRNGNAPVNLIHREDCIGIIKSIIEQDAFGHIYNAVAPHHPAKSAYYRQKASELGLEPPEYTLDASTAYKQVDSVNLQEILGYSFSNIP